MNWTEFMPIGSILVEQTGMQHPVQRIECDPDS